MATGDQPQSVGISFLMEKVIGFIRFLTLDRRCLKICYRMALSVKTVQGIVRREPQIAASVFQKFALDVLRRSKRIRFIFSNQKMFEPDPVVAIKPIRRANPDESAAVFGNEIIVGIVA